MPVNAASRSIHLPDEIAETHSVQFAVHTRLATQDMDQLHRLLDNHLHFLQRLKSKGILGVSGPFFTEDGKNSGNGFYVLQVDSLNEARQIAADDPLHKAGVRIASVEPWLQTID
jgi:uncharacterized protein